MEKPDHRRKTPLVVGGTRTQVLADSMAINTSALNHCATYLIIFGTTYPHVIYCCVTCVVKFCDSANVLPSVLILKHKSDCCQFFSRTKLLRMLLLKSSTVYHIMPSLRHKITREDKSITCQALMGLCLIVNLSVQ